MNLQCNIELAARYRSGAQIARVLSEEWCSRELYCPACDADQLFGSKPNNPAIDFSCQACDQLFQLKSLRKWNPKKIVDAGYESMCRAIRTDRAPNLLVLQYSAEWTVQNLMLIPRMFFSESVIEKRNPLSSNARRAGWVGCNILLSEIPIDGKIAIIAGGLQIPKQHVRDEFSRVKQLGEVPPSVRGWALDVLRIIRGLGESDFSLQDVYRFESQLKELHPHNQNVRPKIRQQLQVLRDVGLVKFTKPGSYKLQN